MRRVPIRVKLLGALAAPLLCLLAVIVVQVADTSRELNEEQTQSDLATAAIGTILLWLGLNRWAPTQLREALQTPRG